MDVDEHMVCALSHFGAGMDCALLNGFAVAFILAPLGGLLLDLSAFSSGYRLPSLLSVFLVPLFLLPH
jgi:hypothetical protein